MPRTGSSLVTFAGLLLSISEWASLLGWNASTLHGRIGRGMTMGDALALPIGAPVAPRRTAAQRRRQREEWHRDHTP